MKRTVIKLGHIEIVLILIMHNNKRHGIRITVGIVGLKVISKINN